MINTLKHGERGAEGETEGRGQGERDHEDSCVHGYYPGPRQ